jgi:uncharacterized membrane protein YbhN (UPF0104 family)
MSATTIKRILTAVIVIVIFYFLINRLVRNWQHIPFATLHFNIGYLAISFALLFVNFVFFVEGWRQIIRTLGGVITFRQAFWTMAASQTAKYIPGGIWFALGRMYLGKSDQLRAEAIGVSVIIETGLTFIVGAILFLFSVMITRTSSLLSIVIMIAAFFLSMVILYPPVLQTCIGICLRILKKPSMQFSVSYSSILFLSVYYICLWVAQIFGFHFLINSVYAVPTARIFDITATYTLSWMAGFVVIIAPSGLGVREGMMSLMLSSFIVTPLAIVISFLSRIWITIFELFMLLIGAIFERSRSGVQPHK